MENPTLHPWRPAIVVRRTPFVVTDRSTKQIENLQCGATRPLSRERCVQSSLPCVGMADRRVYARGPRPGTQCYFLETMAAKEAKRRFDCSGNHLGCPISCGAPGGLQYGLSGSRVPCVGNSMAQHRKGNRLIGNERCAVGKANPYLSRKINSRSCPVQ